ncbi:MAG: SGNH/GDSL hydrolase family protein [Candidatus Alcyoniella australis]|nr:SGNH/GDSL hydrolase family protein [Candidatus Alcyoniella australis]
MARRRPRRLIFALIPLLLLILGGELALRAIEFEYKPFYPRPHTRWSGGDGFSADWWGRLRESDLYVADPELFWSLRPGANEPGTTPESALPLTNSLGLRGPEIQTPKPAERKRVISLGDSCTFGDGVRTDQTYAALLRDELLLLQPDLDVDAVNAGVPGYTSFQALRQLRDRLPALEPDLVTLYLGLNDHITPKGCISDETRSELIGRATQVRGGLQSSRFYQLATYLVLKLRRGDECHDPERGHQVFRVSTPEFQRNVTAIRDLGRERGFKVLLFTIPHSFDYEPSLNPYIRALAREQQIELLDLFRILKARQEAGQSLYNADGGHPNAAGHQAIAQALAQRIVEQGMLGAEPAQSE